MSITSASVWAQQAAGGTDYESPVIEHEAGPGGLLGGVETVGATAVDNEAIASVELLYRFSGETEFASLPMREVAQSSYYSARVDTANVPGDVSAIEYYIRAEDTSGNLTLKGFAFQPLKREFRVPDDAAPEAAPPASEPIVKSSRAKWVYVALGVLVVGGIAAAAGGSDGGGSDCSGGCNVTIEIDPPALQ